MLDLKKALQPKVPEYPRSEAFLGLLRLVEESPQISSSVYLTSENLERAINTINNGTYYGIDYGRFIKSLESRTEENKRRWIYGDVSA